MAKEFFEGVIEATSLGSSMNNWAYPQNTRTLISSTDAHYGLKAWNSQNNTESTSLLEFFTGLAQLGSTTTKYTKIKMTLWRPTGTATYGGSAGNAAGFQGEVNIIIEWGNQVIIRGSLLEASVSGGGGFGTTSLIDAGVLLEVFKVVDISGSSGDTSIVIDGGFQTNSGAPAFPDSTTPILIINPSNRKIIGLPLFYNYAPRKFTKTSISMENDDGLSISVTPMPGEATGKKNQRT